MIRRKRRFNKNDLVVSLQWMAVGRVMGYDGPRTRRFQVLGISSENTTYSAPWDDQWEMATQERLDELTWKWRDGVERKIQRVNRELLS